MIRRRPEAMADKRKNVQNPNDEVRALVELRLCERIVLEGAGLLSNGQSACAWKAESEQEREAEREQRPG
jgi:hypothetical protein